MAESGSPPHSNLPSSPNKRRILGRGSYANVVYVGEILRRETIGGVILVAMAVIAVVWANSPVADSYFALREYKFGFEPWQLDLSLGKWAADGLLAIFFFLVGLELKREFVAGDLRNPARAVVPIVAAVGGVLVPAVIYLVIVANDPSALVGWAIPTATDIAFAVAVLAVIGSNLPSALRIFLLTLAVVDDLIAITIIAIFYTDTLDPALLALTVIPVAVYAFLVQRYRAFFLRAKWAAWVILFPIGFVAWALLHASGVHATIAGVVLGFTVPVLHKKINGVIPAGHGLAEEFEHRFRPLSAGFAVPVFALFAAGVAFGGVEGLVASVTDPIALGIVAALVIGKPIGIVGATWILTRFTRVSLDPSLRWVDLIGVSLLAGIGFTVSLLIADLSFDSGTSANDHAKVGILLASVLAATLAAVLLRMRNRHYRAIALLESADDDGDGIPDVYLESETDRN
ncbi:MAG: Na+/H+ antiporter NhaA [Microbacteriaceae bacterium]